MVRGYQSKLWQFLPVTSSMNRKPANGIYCKKLMPARYRFHPIFSRNIENSTYCSLKHLVAKKLQTYLIRKSSNVELIIPKGIFNKTRKVSKLNEFLEFVFRNRRDPFHCNLSEFVYLITKGVVYFH